MIWIAGVKLADTTDILSSRLHLGKALGGIIMLAVATNLPEVAITVSAALAGNLGVAVGNILAGIAIQTVGLVAMDSAMKDKVPLTYRAASLTLVVEAVLIVSVMATESPGTLIAACLTPGAALIAVLWIIGVWLSSQASKGLPWHDMSGTAPDRQEKPKDHSQAKKDDTSCQRGESTARVGLVFGAAALATLAPGVLLKLSGNAIAQHIGLSGVLFGATVLAAATSLPELSTGYLGAHEGLSAGRQ